MKFEEAIAAIKKGATARRSAWDDRFVTWVAAGTRALVPHPAHANLTSSTGKVSVWAPTMEDMAADDWIVNAPSAAQ